MSPKRLRELLFLSPVLIMLAGLYLYFMQLQDLRLDELITTNLLIRLSFRETLTYLFEQDSPQLIYYFYVYVFKELFGVGLWSMRGASLVLMLLCLVEFYRLCKEFMSPKMSYLGVVILGLSFPFILYGGEIRPYAMLLLLSVTANRYYVLMGRKRSPLDFYKYFVIMALIVGTHLSGFLLFFLHAANAIFDRRSRLWQDLKLAHIGFGSFIAIPMLYQTIRAFNHVHDFRSVPTISDFLGQVSFLFNGKIFLSLSLLILLLSHLKSKSSRYQLFFISIITLPISLLFIKSLISAPAFEARYALYSLPVFILYLCYRLSLLAPNDLRMTGMISAAVVFALLWNLFGHEQFHIRPYRLDSKGVSEQVQSLWMTNPQSMVISCGACLHFYLHKYIDQHLCDPKDNPTKGQLYYVEYSPNQDACKSLREKLQQNRDILSSTRLDQFEIHHLSPQR